MKKGDIFNLEYEDGTSETANIFDIVNIDDKKYVIYTIDNDNGTSDILAAYLINEEIVSIEDQNDKEKITKYIKSINV